MFDINRIENAVSCEDIFENDKEKVRSLYRELAKKYHPDVSTDKNSAVYFAKITELYNEALEKIDKGIWFEKDVLILENIKGKKYKLKYLKKHSFELGFFYVGRQHIIYVLERKNKKYLDNALNVLKSLKYADASMEKEFKRYFPEVVDNFELKTGEYCLVLKKDSTDFLLSDFLEYYSNQGKELDVKHCAWVVSRLSNICCFLKYNHLVHNGISLINCFISPKYHTIMLFGGWWYCVPEGEKLIGTQKSVYDVMPVKEKSEKISTYQTDLECVKQIGRQLNKNLPKPFENWVNKAATKDAFKEFDSWNQALYDSFGERKFIVLDISEKDIYK